MWLPRRSLKLALALTAMLGLALSAQAGQLSGQVRWTGQVQLKSATVVPKGATLTIAAGSRVLVSDASAGISVQGRILVEGSEAAPVVFAAPEGWVGIDLVEGEPSRFRHVRFSKAMAAISSIATPFEVSHGEFRDCETAIKLLRETSPLIEASLFIDNGIGIDNEMKSAPTIRDNRFSGHKRSAILASHNSSGPVTGNRFENNQQAITLLQKYPDRIADNAFVGNESAILCNQTQSSPLIENNRFIDNGYGLTNVSFSYPTVRNNLFRGNRTAVHNDQYGSPLLERNSLVQNGTAVHNNRKSNPRLLGNLIEANELALFCDYSSYPEVKGNNFLDNRMAVKLGIYQSADWEKRSGSRAIVQREAAARQSQNPMLANAPTEFSDFVDVSDNWWGAQTAQLKAAGKDGNPAMFHDRKDQPKVVYEGFGPEEYRLDRIVYHPWREQLVAEVGCQGLQ